MKDNVKKYLYLVFIDRGYLAFYGANLATIARLDLPTDIFRDLEVLDRSGLETRLALFIKQLKLNPGTLIMVLSDNVCFAKDYSEGTAEQQDNILQNFINNIPFENVGHKIYKMAHGFKIIAANKDLYESVKEALDKMGFITVGIAPALSLGLTVTNFDLAAAKFILAKHDLVKQQSFVLPQQIIHRVHVPEKKVFGVRRILLLLGIFSVLLMTLLYLIYSQSADLINVKKPIPASRNPTVTRAPSSRPSPTTPPVIPDQPVTP